MGKRAVNRVAVKIYDEIMNDLHDRSLINIDDFNQSNLEELSNALTVVISSILEEEERQGYLSWQAKSEMSESEDSSAGGDTAVDSV